MYKIQAHFILFYFISARVFWSNNNCTWIFYDGRFGWARDLSVLLPTSKNRAFFSYCIFATIVRGKIAPELTIRVSSPQAVGKITSELLEVTFSSFLSLSAPFFCGGSFRFLFIFFYPFSSFL